MNYNEAFEKVQQNLGLLKNVATGTETLDIPFYKIGAIIAPKNASLLERNNIYTEIVNTGISNEQVLQGMNLLNEDLDIFIIGQSGEFLSMSEFIEWKANNPSD